MKERIVQVIYWIRDFIRTRLRSENEDLPYYLAILIAAFLFIVGINGFIELTEELAENELTTFDEKVTEFVVGFRSEGLTRYLTFVTHLGDRYAYVAVTVLLAAWFFFRYRSWKFVLQSIGVLLLASLSNVILKQVIHRERPSLEHLVTVNTLSYPSGHSMSAMAFYGFLIYLCLRYQMPRSLRFLSIFFLSLLILSIGVSRVYLGVHYPSDVSAGWIGGLIWVAFCAIVFNVIGLWRKRKGNGQEPAEAS